MLITLKERFNSLSDREQNICLITLLMIIWGTWDNFIYQPIQNKQEILTTERNTLEKQLIRNQQTSRNIQSLGKLDPNKVNKEKLHAINQQISSLKQKLTRRNKKFVSATRMVEVLQDMLKQNHGLELISLKKLPVAEISETKSIKLPIYRHGLILHFSGSYFNMLDYLKILEALPWRINWEAIDYQVKQYPIAEITLQIDTLSFQPQWLDL